MGYGGIWSSGGFEPGLSRHFAQLLAATNTITVASGIQSIWTAPPDVVASAFSDLETSYPGRFLLGLGASHAPLVEGYSRPYSHMVSYLDALDALEASVPKERRMIAALGPRMLELAAERAAGAHPYFVPVAHMSMARRIMGEGPLLVPEVTAVLEADTQKARQLAKSFTAGYLGLANYANALRRLGFAEEDLAGGGSDRLIDAVVALGDVEAVSGRIREYLAAGANQVCVQVIGRGDAIPLDAYRELAAALF